MVDLVLFTDFCLFSFSFLSIFNIRYSIFRYSIFSFLYHLKKFTPWSFVSAYNIFTKKIKVSFFHIPRPKCGQYLLKVRGMGGKINPFCDGWLSKLSGDVKTRMTAQVVQCLFSQMSTKVNEQRTGVDMMFGWLLFTPLIKKNTIHHWDGHAQWLKK